MLHQGQDMPNAYYQKFHTAVVQLGRSIRHNSMAMREVLSRKNTKADASDAKKQLH